MRKMTAVICAVAGLAGAGCGIGKSSMLFATNTSVGLDVDTAPPTTALAYNRQEIMLAPEFRGGKVLPAVGAFTLQSDAIGSSVGFGTYQSFIVGDASLTYALAVAMNDKNLPQAARDEVQKRLTDALFSSPGISQESPSTPKSAQIVERERDWLRQQRYLIGQPMGDAESDDQKEHLAGLPETIYDAFKMLLFGDTMDTTKKQPYYFGTNSSFGVAINYTPSGVPRSINVGLKRQELALVPILAPAENDTNGLIHAPSLLSISGVGASVGATRSSSSRVSSVFATGAAADAIATQPYINQTFGGEVRDIRTPPSVIVATTSVQEQDVGDADAIFAIALSRPASEVIAVAYTLAPANDATKPADFDNRAGTVTFQPGQVASVVRVAVHGNTTEQSNRGITLTVVPASSISTSSQSAATCTIIDYGAAPKLVIEPNPEFLTHSANAAEMKVRLGLRLDKVSYQRIAYTLRASSEPPTSGTITMQSQTVEFAAGVSTVGPVILTVSADASTTPGSIHVEAEPSVAGYPTTKATLTVK